MKIDFEVEGVQETIRALKRLNSDRDTRAILISSMKVGATPLVKEARSQIDQIPGLRDRKDVRELKRNITKRTSKSKRFPTVIVGFRKPTGAFAWYQRLVELGTKERRGRGAIKAFYPFYISAKLREKEALRESLAAIKNKYNARARRMGFNTI